MTDIVELLRNAEFGSDGYSLLMMRSADLIESLRKEVTSWKDLYECTSAKDKALIETLSKQVEEWKARWSQENSEHAETIAAAKHEIAELEKERGYDPVTISETTMNKYHNSVINECINKLKELKR